MEMVKELLNIIHCFSYRVYRFRRYKPKDIAAFTREEMIRAKSEVLSKRCVSRQSLSLTVRKAEILDFLRFVSF